MQKQNRENSGSHRRRKNANGKIPRSVAARLHDCLANVESRGSFDLEYLKSEYLSKFCDETVVPSSERRENAILKFLSQESINRRTNSRFREIDPGYNILPRVSYSRFLRVARRFISDVLGSLYDELVIGGFSGGASTSRKRSQSHPANKYDVKADVTVEVLKFLPLIGRISPLLDRYATFTDLTIVDRNILFTVPKKTDIDRCACKEPDLNMYLQKGVGSHIRNRLLRFGINLNDQSINRKLASIGSTNGSLATIDLSSASDSICIEVVRSLLPPLWFEYLNDLRSKRTEIDGYTVDLEMFSSMGNGFTFELESLLFYALMRTVAYFEGSQGTISVYGDDLIIPSGMYDMSAFVLSFFGFSVNSEKSFSTGFFRESCGGHYFHGTDVTPFYLKRMPTRITDVIRVLNQLRNWLNTDLTRVYMFPELSEIWIELSKNVPRCLWGGRDHSLDTQLVSSDYPRSVLFRLTKENPVNETGRYQLWHASAGTLPSESFDPVIAEHICVLRKAKFGAVYVSSTILNE